MKPSVQAEGLSAAMRSGKGWASVLFPGVLICCLLTGFFLPASSAIAAQGALGEVTYRVVFVADDDTLNVRSEPGSKNPAIGSLPPGARGVRVTGGQQMVGNDAWYPVSAGSLQGWVSGRFLTEDIAPESFCQAPPTSLLETLVKALRDRNGPLLASLVHEERGLRVHVSYMNDGDRIAQRDIGALFGDARKKDWGKDQSDEPVRGPFSEAVLPTLDRDLLGATEVSCNTMRLDGSTGQLILPRGAEGINFYSYFRMPQAPDNELDWGAWVVGVEHWDGRYFISYLAHYQWEP